MFRLHETTRRRVCRTAFGLLCAGPMLGVGAWIAYAHRPWRLSDDQTRLSAALRVDVRLADWQTPRPGVCRSTAITLRESDVAPPLTELAGFEQRTTGDSTLLVAEQIAVDAARIPHLARRLDAWMRQAEATECRVCIAKLIVRDGGASATRVEWANVECFVRRDESGTYQAQIVAPPSHGAGDAPAAPVRVAVAATPDAVAATIDATAAALPAWLLAAGVPGLQDLGPDASWTGTARWEFARGKATGTIAGRLGAISLDAIIPRRGPHAARGSAAVQLDELRWRGDAIESAAGVVSAERAAISRSVLAAAKERLFCAVADVGRTPSASGDDLIAVSRLACRFQLDANGLALAGAFPPGAGLPEGCLAASDGRPLALAPPHPRLHPAAWLQFTTGPVPGWVPATREAVLSASRLPLPDIDGNTQR
jgi:hypothetical protein